MAAKPTEPPVIDPAAPVGTPRAEQPARLHGRNELLAPQPDPPQNKPAPRRRWSWSPKFLFRMLKATYREWSNDQVPRMGAALSYYTIFSIAPLLVIAIAIAGFVFGEKAVQGQITSEIQGLIGPESARAVQTMIQSAHKPAHGVIATIIGVVVLLLGASGVFGEMQTALNLIWKVDISSKTGVWNLIRQRFLSFGMVLGIGFLLLVSLMLSAGLSAAAGYLESYLHIPAAIFEAFDFVFSLAIIAALMAAIFKFLPDVKVPWGDVWIGGILTSILFTIGKFLIGFYIGKSVNMSAYGAAASVVVILAWIYYSAQLLYFGAEFTYVYSNECGSQSAIGNKERLATRRIRQLQGGDPQPAQV
jgi:membrane protein